MLKPYYKDSSACIIHGDCLEVLPRLASADTVVTDPPYGLNFMGEGWDHGVPGVEFWERVLVAMKPGAYLLAFGGTRTSHRLTCAIEDAGFEIRDSLMWLYGMGFPKSLDVSKAIDKHFGKKRTKLIGKKRSGLDAPTVSVGGFTALPENAPDEEGLLPIYAPATLEAEQWEGWGTALKPAWEPIILARKPLVETVAANILEHGTGGLNVDACRIATTEKLGGGMVSMGRPKNAPGWDRPWMHDPKVTEPKKAESAAKVAHAEAQGRWPANLILECVCDGPPHLPICSAGMLDAQSGESKSKLTGESGAGELLDPSQKWGFRRVSGGFLDTGGASRFFYCAKTSSRERREGNMHPTVKPLALMRWLVRLVTPPGGIVLDPFMGSGTTLMAARAEGMKGVGIEIEEEYCVAAAKRLVFGPGSRKRSGMQQTRLPLGVER